jgi:branched-chain amino acid transport system substrate-binding protein
MRVISNVTSSINGALKPAGFEKSQGLITATYGKDPTDPRWKDDPGLKEWSAFVTKYLSASDFIDNNAVYGFGAAQTMVQVLKQCGDDLSRENIMKQAANIKDFETPMGLPGAKINTSPDNYSPIRQMQLTQFKGESWDLFGDLLQG